MLLLHLLPLLPITGQSVQSKAWAPLANDVNLNFVKQQSLQYNPGNGTPAEEGTPSVLELSNNS